MSRLKKELQLHDDFNQNIPWPQTRPAKDMQTVQFEETQRASQDVVS